MILGLKNATFGLVTLFTIVETIVLALWLGFANQGKLVLSVVFLFVGLLLEHYLSAFIGKLEGKGETK